MPFCQAAHVAQLQAVLQSAMPEGMFVYNLNQFLSAILDKSGAG
jgi:hypothetical protein